MRHPLYSYSLVTLQFGLILALVLTCDLRLSLLLISFYLLAVGLGVWSLKTMHLGQFNIVPDPMPDLQLVTTGPYARIRHPMYAAVLIFMGTLVLGDFSLTSAALFIGLLSTLLVKLLYEEHLLREKLSDYAQYQERTWRLVPWIF